MLFSALLTTLTLTGLTIATPITSRQSDAPLSPWEITSLFSYKPSSQPGPPKASSISLRISDPNTIKLMRASRFGFAVLGEFTADCTVSWSFPDGQPPFNQEILCSPFGGSSNGNISVTLLPGSGGETVLDFGVKIVEKREALVLGNQFYREFEGEAHFKAGDNYQGSCGEAGVCAGRLEGEVEVNQIATEIVGTCEEYNACT